MTQPVKNAGSTKKRSYSEAEKITILKILEKNDFNVSKTAQKTNISRSNIKRWREELGDKVFTTQPTTAVIQQVANQAARIDLAEIDNEIKRRKIAGKALDILLQRLEEKPDKFSPSILIELSQLDTQPSPQQKPNQSHPNSIIEEWTQKYTRITRKLQEEQ